MENLPGFAALADRYDGFILDLWGVIHDGVAPYPGAVDCLLRLRDAGKRVVLLSNAPRRAHAAAKAMQAMGIFPDFYTGIVTSGEVTHRCCVIARSRSFLRWGGGCTTSGRRATETYSPVWIWRRWRGRNLPSFSSIPGRTIRAARPRSRRKRRSCGRRRRPACRWCAPTRTWR